jgi:hypothetical protein
MRILVYIAVAIMVAVFWYGVICLVQDVLAEEVSLGAHVRWNCSNFFTSPHPMPVSLENDGHGNWDVLLEDGSMLYGTMLGDGFQKWILDDMSWVTDGIDVVYCESDAKSISILLAQ